MAFYIKDPSFQNGLSFHFIAMNKGDILTLSQATDVKQISQYSQTIPNVPSL